MAGRMPSCASLLSISALCSNRPPWRSRMGRHGALSRSQHRCAAEPYKLRRAARLAATARLDTGDYNHARGPRDFGDQTTNLDRSGSTPLTGANSYPRRRNFGAGPPKAGCACSTHAVGAISPLKHMQMCSALVMRRQLVQIQPSAPFCPSSSDSGAPDS